MTDEKQFCAFCYIWENQSRAVTEILWQNDTHMVLVPINPITEGHVMLVPRRHTRDAVHRPYDAADAMQWAGLWLAGNEIENFHIITSGGVHSGRTVPHLNMHIVPRREGDGLVMPWTRQKESAMT